MKGVFFKRVIKPHEPCHPQTFLTPPPQPPSVSVQLWSQTMNSMQWQIQDLAEGAPTLEQVDQLIFVENCLKIQEIRLIWSRTNSI